MATLSELTGMSADKLKELFGIKDSAGDTPPPPAQPIPVPSFLPNGSIPQPGMAINPPENTPFDPAALGLQVPGMTPPEASKEEQSSKDALSRSPAGQAASQAFNAAASQKQIEQKPLMEVKADPFQSLVKQAIEKRDADLRNAQLMKYAGMFQAGLMGPRSSVLPNQLEEPANDMIKQSGRYLEDVNKIRDEEKFNPKSGSSQMYRELARKMGVRVDDNTSAADLEKASPLFTKLYDAEQMRIAKVESARQSAADRKEARQDRMDFQQRIKDDASMRNFMKDINPATASGRSVLGAAGKTLQQAQQIQALLDSGDNSWITNRQYQEAVRSLDSMLSRGGSGSVYGQQHLAADTADQRLAKAMELITSKPQDPKVQAFADEIRKTVAREAAVAQNQALHNINAYAKAYPGLKDRKAEDYEGIQNAARDMISTPQMQDFIDQHAPQTAKMFADPNKHAGKKDSKVQQYADQHFGGNYDQAKQLLMGRGYQPQEQ